MVRDDEVVNTLRMEAEDGEVLAFDRSGNIASLVVTWICHSTRIDETHAYQFDFDTFELQAEEQEQAEGE
jgi:hypothetical protein